MFGPTQFLPTALGSALQEGKVGTGWMSNVERQLWKILRNIRTACSDIMLTSGTKMYSYFHSNVFRLKISNPKTSYINLTVLFFFARCVKGNVEIATRVDQILAKSVSKCWQFHCHVDWIHASRIRAKHVIKKCNYHTDWICICMHADTIYHVIAGLI